MRGRACKVTDLADIYLQLIVPHRHHALSREKPLRGADAPNYKRATTKVKRTATALDPLYGLLLERSSERSRAKLPMLAGAKTAQLAPLNCSEFKFINSSDYCLYANSVVDVNNFELESVGSAFVRW